MNHLYSSHTLSYRICASILIILHLIAFGPVRDALAFTAQSQSYRLSAGALNDGGRERANLSTKLWQDSLGEPAIGKASSASYSLNAGLIAILQTNPPFQIQAIPYQTWPLGSGKTNAFDLDDYFASDTGALSYTVSGNSQISVSLDPTTHIVSFSQPAGWSGKEAVYFSATDSEGNSTQSDRVVLQVENPQGPDSPVIVEVLVAPQTIKEGDLVKLTVKAKDLDNDQITFTYNQLFTPTNIYQFNGYWYSEATWQTSANSKGHYSVRLTVKDPSGLTDAQDVLINVGNFNNPPVLNSIADIVKNEGDLVVLTPNATDPDNDTLSFYYNSPFDSSGKWLTGYEDAGTYFITVTASDGIDSVSQTAKVIVANTNRAPQATLTLSKYTVQPNETVSITLSASDPDNDAINYVLYRDSAQLSSGPLNASYTTSTSFSTEGKYTLSAVIADTGGLSTTVTKNIDVSLRKSAQAVMGDFNGDALTDLGTHDTTSGNWEICLSQKGVFESAGTWLTNFGANYDWQPIGGDFNGDARTDIGIYNSQTGEVKIALSSGSNFSSPTTWLTISFASNSWQVFTGNFNGDKYTDIGLYNKDIGEVRVYLGTGTSFNSYTIWLTNFGPGYTALGGDFNGDGLTDLCLFNKTSGEFKIAFSNSKAFVDESSWMSGYSINQDPLLSDFNNDGLTDIGYWDKSSHRWYYAISTGEKFLDKGSWLESFGDSQADSATTGDFDGNGITDAATFDSEGVGITRWKTQVNTTTKPADLLTQIDNGIGGKTQVTYTYAASSDNPGLPFSVYVASQVKLIDTLPTSQLQESYVQLFSYSGGYFDAQEREFRGFQKVKVTDPITNNYSETYFYQGRSGQDGALKGQIEKIISSDGNGKKISQTLNTYEVRKSGPQANLLGFPALTQSQTTVWEENETNITTRSSLSYDNIGNLIEGKDEGDTSKTGDEKSSATSYNQAYTTGYNRPNEVVLKDKDGNTVSKKSFAYDDKGNLSAEAIEINNPLTGELTNPTTRYTYDSFGNLLSATNALEKTVTTDYETTYYTYPEKTTNSLDQSVRYTYEPKFGLVKSTTDANGLTSSTSYDSLSRPLKKTINTSEVAEGLLGGGEGSTTLITYAYPDFNTKTTTNAIGLSATDYIDGLGRKYKTVSVGEDGANNRQISSEVYYNNRGMVERESLPHYIDEDTSQIAYVKYEYDIRGRIKKTISDFPGTAKDAQSSINYINPLYVEIIDPQGHKKGTLKDVYGNIIEVIEYAGTDGVFHTYYEYDTQGNLLKTTDNQNNVIKLTYDSIGRKIKMQDPDMGTWSYEYDLIGNLKKQTDAKGQVLEFEYDDLNRLKKKQGLSQGGTVPVFSVTYLYDDSTKPNCIGRLSKVTDQSGSTEFFYDNLGRETKSIKTVSGTNNGSQTSQVPDTVYTVQREYDILDRLTKLTYPDGEVVNYGYDSNSGLLETVNGTRSAVNVAYVSNIDYNAQGQMKAASYGNGTSTTYTYGQDLRLSRILTRDEGRGTTFQDLNYLFDQNGNVSTLTDNLRSNIRSYTYDDLDRLTQAQNVPNPNGGYTTFSYQYDSIGNMIYKSDLGVMSYGGIPSPLGGEGQGEGTRLPHALTNAGGYSYQYDANGNMVTGKNKTMKYDPENRLSRVIELTQTTNFTYDGDGGRVRKTVNTSGVAEGLPRGEEVTTYIGSLYEIATAETAEGPQRTQTKHIFAGANRIATVSLRGAGGGEAISYYHSDHLGSSNIITDSSGTQVQYCEYTPYGTTARNEGTDLIKHKFTGKELDPTGLYYYGARYYDPEIGRFISADTIVQAPYDPQSLNRYAYARNNPIKYTDPSGHFFWFAALIFVATSAAIGAVVNVAITGAMGQLTSWTAFWAAMGSGAVAGAVAGIGSFVPGAGTILGGLLIGAVAGGTAGAVGSSISGAFSWGAVGMGAAFGGTLGGFGNSSAGRAVGRAVGKGVGKLPYGQHIQNAGRAVGNKMSSLYNEAKNTTGFRGSGAGVPATKNARIVVELEMDMGESPTVYRRGTFAGNSNVKGEQWAHENPLSTSDYSRKYGLPLENSGNPDWVVKGHIVGEYGQGSAPRSYNNPTNTGGATEIRINNPDDIQLDWFHMPDD